MEKQATNPRVTSFLVSPWNTRLGIPEYQKGSIIYFALIRIQQRNEIKQFFHLTSTSLYPRIIFHFLLSFRKRRKTLSFSSFIQLFRYINWSLKNCFDDVPYDYPRILIVLDACHGSIKPINSPLAPIFLLNPYKTSRKPRTKLILFLDFTSNWTGSSNRVRKILGGRQVDSIQSPIHTSTGVSVKPCQHLFTGTLSEARDESSQSFGTQFSPQWVPNESLAFAGERTKGFGFRAPCQRPKPNLMD